MRARRTDVLSFVVISPFVDARLLGVEPGAQHSLGDKAALLVAEAETLRLVQKRVPAGGRR